MVYGKTGYGLSDIVRDKDGTVTIHSMCPFNIDSKPAAIIAIIWDSKGLRAITGDYTGLGLTGEALIAIRDNNGDALFITPLRYYKDAELKRRIPKKHLNVLISKRSSAPRHLRC
ncbi:MAG: hypothetical protein HQK94_17960 [Nitrospirae bacterium]|nr:hypothetical protein [Nitrospirota bacterium]